MVVYPTYAIKTSKSAVGTVNIVAADFNPPKMTRNLLMSAVGTVHITY
jgi:hypothetical protein